jgi:transposase
VSRSKRLKELVEKLPDLAVLVEPLLLVRRVLREQIIILHRRLLATVRGDEVCRRLMTIPGVGPVVALTYRATVCGHLRRIASLRMLPDN